MAIMRYLAVTVRATKMGYQILVTVVLSCYLIQDFLDRKKTRKRE